MIIATVSAIGKEYQMPFAWKNIGKKRTSGIRKIICLLSVRNKAIFALPTAKK